MNRLGLRMEAGRSPLFETMFNYLEPSVVGQVLRLGEVGAEGVNTPLGAAKFDLTLIIMEQAREVSCYLEYSTQLFKSESAELLGQRYRLLAQQVADKPEVLIGELELMEAAEKRRVLEEFNDTKREYPSEKCVQELFEAMVDTSPERIALVFGQAQMTYGQLEVKANRLARRLREYGVGPDVLVGLCLERSMELVVGILGILKAGGAYVPLDPTYPTERLNVMLEDSATRIVLTKGAVPAGVKIVGTALDLADNTSYAAEESRPEGWDEPRSSVCDLYIRLHGKAQGSNGGAPRVW